MAERRADEQAEPDFAEEHTRPTVADEPGPDAPDESVPTGQAGDGGLDLRNPIRRWWHALLRRR